MNYSLLKNRIKKNEGLSTHPYKDQLGNYTIGYGHLIQKNESIFFKKKFKKPFFQNLFENDFNRALKDYKKYFSKFSFSKKTQELIVEMIFQIGIKKFFGFKKTLKHIKINNKYMASLEILDSLLYKQTPRRVEILIKNFLKQ